MSLQTRYRKPRRPSSDDSLTDALFDQLLGSLEQGPDASELPSDEEYQRFKTQWARAHPGDRRLSIDERWPWRMQRRRAAELVELVPHFLRLAIVYEEAETPEAQEFHRRRWADWGTRMIEDYGLEGLVEVHTVSDHGAQTS